MASEEEVGKDDFGSLFEGMLLFNPTQIAQPDENKDDHNDGEHHQDQPLPLRTDDDVVVVVDDDDDDEASLQSSSMASQPLDENLFSDLTLVTPLQPLSDPSSSSIIATTATVSATPTAPPITPSQSLSRQLSSTTTRKKKRAGLRIGYGRDSPVSDAVELGFPPSSSSVSTSAETRSAQNDYEEEAASSLNPASSTTSADVEKDLAADVTSISRSIDNPDLPDTNSVSDPEPKILSRNIQEFEDKGTQNNGEEAIELKFDQIRAQISEKLRRVRELVDSVSDERKFSTSRRRKAAHDLSMAWSKYKELEKQLEEACEAEDFETAESVSESLASAEMEKERLAIDLRDAEADSDAIEFKMQEALESQIQAEEECASFLQQFAADAANKADSVLKNVEVMSAKEMDKWQSPTEALEVKKIELEIHSHLINEAQLTLNESIEQSVENDRKERELLSEKKDALTEELEMLLALVKAKESEIAETNSNIEMVEKRISDVVSGFHEAQSSMDAEYDKLQSNLSQIALDNEAFARKKEETDILLSKEADRGAKLRELAHTSADEANVYQEVVGLRRNMLPFISKYREDKARLAKKEEKLSEDVQMLRQEVSAVRASLQELSSTKSSMQQEIGSLKQRLIFTDKRVPQLEADKKVAAAVRNFKEVARIASEAKALTGEKEAVQVKLAGSTVQLEKVEEEIKNTVNRLQETEDQISVKEKDVAVNRFQRLLLIAGAATCERSAALEFGDIAEAEILLAEAESADSEARKLQLVYDFKREELETLPKHFISMKLVSKLSGNQLAELAASAQIAL